jgi:hypothetical protein
VASGSKVSCFGSHSAGFGANNEVSGRSSFSIGENNKTTKEVSIACGNKAKIDGVRSFCWNGKTTEYNMTGDGIFAINPINGIDSFYIGTQTLREIIISLINQQQS